VLVLLLVSDAASSPPSLALFGLVAFTFTAIAGEYARGIRARRLMSSDSHARAFVSMVRRNRRRYGGYAVHLGISVVLIGVAASSAFNTQRDVRLQRGETTRVAGYDVRYLRPTAKLSNEKIDFGAIIDVRRNGKRVTLLRPSRSYFPSEDASMGPIGRFFRGDSTSEVGLRTSLSKDIWTAMQPDLRTLNGPIREANRRFAGASPKVQALILAALAGRYLQKGPPATFRLIVNPMVSWIWLGGLIVLGGALTVLWPAALTARRRVTSVSAARLGREPSSA
jgi:cytochrome c-type biogenesis protein CcmF